MKKAAGSLTRRVEKLEEAKAPLRLWWITETPPGTVLGPNDVVLCWGDGSG